MQVRLERDDLRVLVEDLVGVELLARLVGPDVDVASVAEPENGAVVLRFVIRRVEAESDLQVRAGIAPVRMEVDGVRNHL